MADDTVPHAERGAHVCEVCELVTMNTLDTERGFAHRKIQGLREEVQRRDACGLCTIIWHALASEKWPVDVCGSSQYENARIHLRLCPRAGSTGKKFKYARLLVFGGDTNGEWGKEAEDLGVSPCIDVEKVIHNQELFRSFRYLGLYSEAGIPGEEQFTLRRSFSDSGSKECFSLAKKWLQECLDNHGTHCRGSGYKPPTRLVELGSSLEDCRLVMTKDIRPSASEGLGYVALSYCWGTDKFLTTTSGNITEFMSRIPFYKLPATIRDTIKATRDLGFCYLWVDSLCIIQGSDSAAIEDWRRESSNMNDIYGGATLTISAAQSSSANQGLFHDRAVSVPMHALKATSEWPGKIHLGGLVLYNTVEEPIDRRAWTFQEQFLSHRILSYRKHGIHWMCYKSQHHEMRQMFGAQGISRSYTPVSSQKETKKYMPSNLYDNWFHLISDYSKREITHLFDKLPAISGLAQKLRAVYEDKYKYGLWESQLPDTLMWLHAGQNGLYARQSDYRAPSWSWASVDGRIRFPLRYRSYSIVQGILCQFVPEPENILNPFLDEPLQVFGPIVSIPALSLRIGCCFSISLGEVESQSPTSSGSAVEIEGLTNLDDLESYGASLQPDGDSIANPYLLKLGIHDWGTKKGSSFGIILIEKQEGIFQRIGIFQYMEIKNKAGTIPEIFQWKWVTIV